MSAYTLFDLTYRVARELGAVVEGTVTSGTTTTTLDNIGLKDRYQDKHFTAGTIWILPPSSGTYLAPQGELARITGFTAVTGSINHNAFTVAASAGMRYAVANAEYTKDNIISNINKVLSEIP